MSGNLKNRMYAVWTVWMCERAENKWTNVGEQQSMFKIVRLVVKTSQNLGKLAIVEALYYLDLEIFHALQNLENKWRLWT